MSGPRTRFVAVGAAGYALNLAVFAALARLGAPYVAAAVAAYLLANAAMYAANRRFTFRRAWPGAWRDYPRYLAAGLIVVALALALLAALVEGLGADPHLAQGVALAALTPVAFRLIRSWAFGLAPP